MTDTIKDLDAAVAGKEAAAEWADEYPDAPPWAAELAKEIKSNEIALDREEQRREQRRDAMRARLQAGVAKTRQRIAHMAASAGVATNEEKQMIKEATKSGGDGGGQSALGSVFDPANTE
jgi:hypothetical protein